MQFIFVRVSNEATNFLTGLGVAATLVFTSSNGRWALYQIDLTDQDMGNIQQNLGSAFLGSVFLDLP